MSSDDPFRDDHDAALARIAALERDKARLEEENAELRAPKPKPKPKRERPKQERKQREEEPAAPGRSKLYLKIAGWVIAGVALFGTAMFVDCGKYRDHDAWKRERDALAASISRWNALVAVGACLRDAALADDPIGDVTPASIDPRDARTHAAKEPSRVEATRARAACVDLLASLVVDPSIPLDARGVLAAWIDAAHASVAAGEALGDYLRGDWRDDDYVSAAPKLRALQAAAARRIAAVRRAAPVLAPIAEREIRAIQSAYMRRAGRDDTWWQIEFALAFEAVLDDIARASREHADVDAVVKAGARRLYKLARGASEAVRHRVNADNDIARMALGYARDINYYWPSVVESHPAPFPPLRREPELPND